MQIIQEDKNFIVVYKEAGLASQTAKLGEKDLLSEVKNYLVQRGAKNDPYLAIINRLDQPVEGLVLLARNKKAAAQLSAELNENKIEKSYLAIVHGELKDRSGQLIDYVTKSKTTNLSEVVSDKNKDAKRAELIYNTVCSYDGNTLVEIRLLTGRHHQIRVQFSHLGYPLLGDKKYGTEKSITYVREHNIRMVALCAYKLSFYYPGTEKLLTYQIEPHHTLIQKMRGNNVD